MRRVSTFYVVAALLANAAVCVAQEFPKPPPPTEQHAWLKHLTGEWESESEIYMEPGKPPIKSKGTETARMIGGFWLLAENKGTIMDQPMTGILTLGFDPETRDYVGTWVDSMTSYQWKYVGKVDDKGTTLTLETKGPCPKKPGTLSNFKEVMELKDKDQKVFTSSMQEDDGSWTKVATISYRRKK
jgi:uncharacterized protein DUF1579